MTGSFSPDGNTRLLVLFGQQLSHSPSPATHSRWARALNLNLQYTALQIANEAGFEQSLRALLQSENFLGGNITNPFKSTALRIEGIAHDPTVQLCGAANTLYRNLDTANREWTLGNTDYLGCLDSLDHLLSSDTSALAELCVVIFGRGAMMRTCALALQRWALAHSQNVKLWIAGRTRDSQAQPEAHRPTQSQLIIEYIELKQKNLTTHLATASGSARRLLCINTLPSATSPEAEKVTHEAMHAINSAGPWMEPTLFCVTYGQQSWHQSAQQLGWRVLNGDLLFERQARAAFRLWTGQTAPTLPTALTPT